MSLENSVSERGEKEVRDCVFVVMKLLLVCGVRNWSLMVLVLFVKKIAKSSAVRVDEGGGGGGQRVFFASLRDCSGHLLFFETTIMGKTADLAMIQKTNIDTLHKEGKSQKVITERCGCLQSAVSKHIKCKVDWKEEFG